MARYILQPSQAQSNGWVCTDTENKIVCQFTEHQFNETQHFTFLDSAPTDALLIARLMREMAEWLRNNHYNLAMPQPKTHKQ